MKKINKPRSKWKFAIGTTSLVPGVANTHYVIVDIDCKEPYETEAYLRAWGITNIVIVETKHGYHFYTNWKMPRYSLFQFLSTVPNIDRKWLLIGKRRGYLFLADYDYVQLLWPVLRMVIHYGKKKKRDA